MTVCIIYIFQQSQSTLVEMIDFCMPVHQTFQIVLLKGFYQHGCN